LNDDLDDNDKKNNAVGREDLEGKKNIELWNG